MQKLGQTRSSFKRNHYLQTPDTFIRAPLPGMKDGTAIVHAGPGTGAGFCQYTAELSAGGMLGPAGAQRFIYVLEGVIRFESRSGVSEVNSGGYSYMFEQVPHTVAAATDCRLAVIEKRYIPLPGIGAPQCVIGREDDVPPQPLMGDPALQVRTLLPDAIAHDFAVNTMTFEPGATLSLVEMHVMEHGLLMLAGEGIYRLSDSWYPVSAGDFIYMGPFCPQWFGALGKTPAKYLIYKDWNRHPAGAA